MKYFQVFAEVLKESFELDTNDAGFYSNGLLRGCVLELFWIINLAISIS